jgi:hypothetical protein
VTDPYSCDESLVEPRGRRAVRVLSFVVMLPRSAVMKWLTWLVAVVVVAVPTLSARADPILDGRNDFLPTYTGPHNADLDVWSVNGTIGATEYHLRATLGAPFGSLTPTGIMVWGLDRGQGTARFATGNPPTGFGVLFDAVVTLNTAGVARFNDLLNPANSFNLDPSDVHINGDEVGVDLDRDRIPSTGFDPLDFTFNLWPRSGRPQDVGNRAISDFAPDMGDPSTANAAFSIPEPASVLLFGLAAGVVGVGYRRRKG